MSERPYPEAIRGAWFLLPVDETLDKARQEHSYDVIIFHIDNSYELLTIKGGILKNSSSGNYTFDGDFLITRARATETYRVTMQHHTQWSIETKKGMRPMYRALHPIPQHLDEGQLKDLRILPIKARAEMICADPHSPLQLTMNEVQLATISVDRWETNKTCWFGIMPLVEGIEPRTWLRIIQESVFALTLDHPEGFDTIEVLMLDARDATTHQISL